MKKINTTNRNVSIPAGYYEWSATIVLGNKNENCRGNYKAQPGENVGSFIGWLGATLEADYGLRGLGVTILRYELRGK